MISAMTGAAGAGKDELFKQAELLAPGRVARVALGDEIKDQANGACLSRFQISAWTENREEKARIRPYLEEFGRNHGPQLLPMVIHRAEELEAQGRVVFVPRVQNANEMHEWVSAGARAVYVLRCGYLPATEQEGRDIDSILRLHIPVIGLHASELGGVRRNAEYLLNIAGVRV